MDEPTVTAVADPPQTTSASATTDSTAELEKHSSFLGYRPGFDDSVEEPATSKEAENTEQAETPTEQTETTTTEETDDPNWLPDEQQKVFPDDVVAKYGKRYGYSAEEIAADPRIRQALHDKINSDIFIAQQRAEAEAGNGEEPTLKTETGEQPANATVIDPVEQRKQYYAALDQFVEKNLDQNSVNELGLNMLSAFGVKLDDPEYADLVKNAPVVGKTLARGAVDLMNTALPSMVNAAIERVFPGFSQMYERVAYAEEWDGVRNATGPDGQKLYDNLPEYGSKEFRQATRTAAAQIPGFEGMVFRDKAGNVLPFRQQTAARYALLAKIMSGQKITPETVAQAVNTGKRLERKATEQRRAGQALGAGQSKGTLTQPDGDINSEIMAAYNARHGSAFGMKR